MGIMFILVFINVVTRYIFGFSFATTEEISTFLVDGRFPALVVPQYLFNGISSFPLMAVPFFILAAEIMTASGLTGSLLRFANDLVVHIRGDWAT